MSINIGDNFKYLGKHFLDARQSFATIEEMKQCERVPDGFITYCKEDEKRYEFKSSNTINELTGKWTEFTININNDNSNDDNEGGNNSGDGDDVIIVEKGNCSYMGPNAPEDTDVIWFFDETEGTASGIVYDNPLIAELFAYIQSLQSQITQLQADVEYLKLNGGGGIPSEPEGGGGSIGSSDMCLALEDGGLFALEDGSGYLILEASVATTNSSTLILEDGSNMLLEDNGLVLLE